MGEDYGYQDPEVEIKESGDVDFVEFADSIADGKDHSVTFYDIAPEGSVMLVYNYDHAQDKLEVISYDENYTEETLYVREHGDVTAGSIENISAFTENHFRDTFQKIERDEDIPIISTETPEIEEEPMDFQTLLDLEHSQNDEMEEQQNQEIDFGEQQDGIPDERYEGMTSYEEDDLSFLPTAEENMMAEVLSVEGEKPEYVVENPDVHADYGMDKLSPDGQKAIAEAMDKSVMTPLASGFIDFELREGFRGNTDGLTSDDISKLREHDPGFGKIIGIDTTKFYTSGPEKNVTIIKLDYEDIKPALSIDQKGFEKENIDTKTLTTELMVSVSGSLAQQESISISANQKMSYQRRMERGEFITCTAPYGYRIVNKKDLEIVPEEAATVRWIFDAYLKGRSSGWIAEQLTAKGIPSQSGAECWRETGIRYLLTNEKYIGDALSQKSYSCGFPFVQKRNHGERLQYYTENSHPAIIDRDTFERVQVLLQKKAQKEKKRREKSPLALKIVCGNCGTVFQRRSSQNGYVTWVCRTHDRHAADCPVGRIPEAEIHAAFLRMYHRLKSNADIILAPALRQLNTLDTILRQNHPQVLAINRAIAEATEESHKISTLRANGLLDADICAARMNAISARLAQLRGERRRLTENEAIDETMDALRKVEQTLLNGPERLDGFDEELFEHLVEKIIAESQNRIRFRLYGGLELTEQWEVAAR